MEINFTKRLLKYILSLGFIVCFSLNANIIRADEAKEKTKGVYTLGEIVVSGERSSAIEKATSMQVITEEDLRRNGAQNLTEALRLSPGLEVRRAPNGARIDMRGYRNRHVKILMNGIPMAESLDATFNPDLIPTANIAKIKVTRGNSSLLYGPGAVAGVIDIITKKGTTEGLNRIRGEMGVTQKHTKGTAELARSSEKASFYLMAQTGDYDRLPLSNRFKAVNPNIEDGDEREHAKGFNHTLFLNSTYSPSDKSELGFSAYFQKSQESLPRSIEGQITNNNRTAKYLDRANPRDMAFQLSGRSDFSEKYTLRGWAFFTDQKQETKEHARYANPNFDPVTLDAVDRSKRYGGSILGTYNSNGKGSVTFASNLERGVWSGESYSYRPSGGAIVLDNHSKDRNTQKQITGTMEYSLNTGEAAGILEKFSFTVGASIHDFSWSDNNTTDYSLLFASTYNITDDVMLRGNIGRLVREPSLKQLYDASNGNLDLNAEVAVQGEMGVDVNLPYNSLFKLTWFLSDITDFIDRSDTTARTYINRDKLRFQGIETELSQNLTDNFSWDLGYTYLDAKDRSDGRQRDRLQYRPRHKVSGGLNYITPIDLAIRVQGVLGADSVNYNKGGKVDSYVVFDSNFIYPISEHVEVNLKINNIFDEDYYTTFDNHELGREIILGLGFTF